jgi:hypothetical protein
LLQAARTAAKQINKQTIKILYMEKCKKGERERKKKE